MIEHAFYQGFNLVQALYLHGACVVDREGPRLALAVLCTAPWLVRGWFPVHPFSDNYLKHDARSTPLVRAMYRAKKVWCGRHNSFFLLRYYSNLLTHPVLPSRQYQYMFYKHALLHGLNVSVAMTGVCLSDAPVFRLYWLLLNAAYVLEFFLQTLVKKRHMTQNTMLGLQWLLMGACTAAAARVLPHVTPSVALLSLGLNLVARRRDVRNTLLVIAYALVWT
jgi:hypothetical protein